MSLFFLICFLLSGQALSFLAFPSSKNVFVGDKIEPDFNLPGAVLKNLSLHVNQEGKQYLQTSGSPGKNLSFLPGDESPVAGTPGTFHMQVKLFGMIPVREMVVNVVPRTKVIPGGQSIGVLLHTHGVMVVGMADIKGKGGKKVNPAVDAGISVGDIILKVNDLEIKSDAQLRSIIDNCGKEKKPLQLKIKRKDKTFSTTIKPTYCSETRRYRLGLFIRDSAAGVGTLTFYHPESGSYGALGHMIADIDTAQQIDLADGCVVGANIQSIHPGKRGRPGEKIGLFEGKSTLTGNITKNTRYGIFGKLDDPVDNPVYDKPVPVALNNEIKPGPAQILTVVKGNRIEQYDIEIEKVLPNSRSDGKGLILKITDRELLQCTGGIIQGMSGSPIIQEGRLVGAVTHVFINDPTRGYGVLAEWMLKEADISMKSEKMRQVSEAEKPHFLSEIISKFLLG